MIVVPITLPTLRTVGVTLDDSCGLPVSSNIFDGLTLPMTQELHICVIKGFKWSPDAELYQQLENLCCLKYDGNWNGLRSII